jgi:hypothetical protein
MGVSAIFATVKRLFGFNTIFPNQAKVQKFRQYGNEEGEKFRATA